MRRIAVASWLCWLLSVVPAAAQTHPASLATLFEDVYGPNGLVLNSDDVQLDGTNHAAHFNSAFQSDFRLVNIALTSQLDRRPAAVARLRVHLQVRFRHWHVRAVDEQLRADPLGSRRDHRPRAGSRSASRHQFFSFDHLDGVPLTDDSGGLPPRHLPDRRRPRRRRLDGEHDRGDGEPVHRRADLRHHRSRRRVAGGAHGAGRGCRCSRTRTIYRLGTGTERAGALLPRRPRDRRLRLDAPVLHRGIGGRDRRSVRRA